MDILNYKDYEGTAELDISRQVCRGKVLFIDDLVTYEASSPAKLRKAFEAAVDDYLETCTTLNRPPKKPLKGQFNVRIPPALHKAAALRAISEGVSLNEVVVRALDAFVNTGAGPAERQKGERERGAVIGVSSIGLVTSGAPRSTTTGAVFINPAKRAPRRRSA